MLKLSLSLCAAFTGAIATPVLADDSASAEGQVVIVRPVGTGVAFNTITEALSGAFLSGQPGDAVSLVLPSRARPARVPVEVVVLSATSFDLGGALAAPAAPTAPEQGGAGQLFPAGLLPPPGNLLFLAQFN